MPIEGYWNTVKAFFLTQADLEESDRLNTYANESLWYVQYFFGRETIEQKVDKFYLVQKPETAGKASWIPSSLKTAAYFLSALIWIVPGAIARLLSFDSEEVKAAVFADRITLPPPKTQEVPRPASPPPAAPPSPPAPISPPTIPASAPAPKNAPLSQPNSKLSNVRTTFQIEATARATTDINHHRIFNELESSIVFFRVFNALTGDRGQAVSWLREQQRATSYRQPFMFGFHLHAALDQNRKKILSIIPPQNLQCWLDTFTDAAKKLKEFGLTADEVEFLEEEKQLQQEKKSNGFIGILKSILCSGKLSESTELNTFADYITGFYTTLRTLKSSRAEWLQRNGMEPGYFSPFFNALYYQAWTHPSLDPHKLRRLAVSHNLCVQMLYEEGLEHHLTEIPNNLSPGFCALVHCMTQHLTLPPQPSVERVIIGPDPKETQFKPLLTQGISSLAYVPGMQAILQKDQHFQRNKYKLLCCLEMNLSYQTFFFKGFLRLGNNAQKNMIIAIKKASVESNIGFSVLFSTQYSSLIDPLQPILNSTVYSNWRTSYTQCQRSLKKLKLLSLKDAPTPSQDIEQAQIELAKDFIAATMSFFKRFISISDQAAAVWLAQEASKRSYIHPFFHSFDLKCKMEKIEPHLNPASASEWKTLYEQVCSKLVKTGLTHYWNEIPPRYFENLMQSIEASLIHQLDNNGSNTPASQPFITSTKGMARTNDSNSNK